MMGCHTSPEKTKEAGAITFLLKKEDMNSPLLCVYCVCMLNVSVGI